MDIQTQDGILLKGIPDGTPDDVIKARIAQIRGQSKPDAPLDPTEGNSFLQNAAIGAGKAAVDTGRGIRQLLSKVGIGDSGAIQQEIDDAARLDAPLMRTGGGIAGNIGGQVATTLLPGGAIGKAGQALTAFPRLAGLGSGLATAGQALTAPASIGAAAAAGAGMGAVQPTTSEQGDLGRLANMAFGAGGAAGGQYLGNKVADWMGSSSAKKLAELMSSQNQNAVKDATLAASKDAGYVIPPSQQGAGMLARLAEGLSGKYKTNQLAGIRNQDVTDSLARKAVGLADDAPLTSEALQSIRKSAFDTGYAPLAQLGDIPVGGNYLKSLDDIASKYTGAANSFPGAAKSEVPDLVNGLKVQSFDAGDGLKMTQILRDNAGKAFASGDKALGKASKEAANTIENEVEAHLVAMGEDGAKALKSFRDARTVMAKAHTVEDAIVEGGGNVDAMKLARRFQAGKPLTDELKSIGQFANNFKDVARVPKSGDANPFTVLDFAAGGLGSGISPMAALMPAGRVAARYSILSKPVQAAMGPDYQMSMLAKLLADPNAQQAIRRGAMPLGLAGALNATQ